MSDHPECPICIKLARNPPGHIIALGPTLTCCSCQKTWVEHEFLGDVKAAGLAYYFVGSLNGQIVIYDPAKEKHEFIEKEAKNAEGAN